MVVQAYNTNYLEGLYRMLLVQSQPRKNVSKIISQNQAGYGGTHFNSRYMGGKVRRIMVRGQLRQS
jgi:hypothetical protein